MSMAHLLAFNLTLLAAFLSPGPALLYALGNTLRGGLFAGVVTGAGLGLVAAGWTLVAFLGLQAMFAIVPWAYGALKLAGGAYLIWLAVQIWRGAGKGSIGVPVQHTTRTLWNGFVGGMLINLANPKSVLFAASVLVVIFPAGLPPHHVALIVANHLALELVGYGILAWALSRPAARQAYLGARVWLDRVAALVLAALGARLVLPDSASETMLNEGTP